MSAREWVELVEATLRPVADPVKAIPMRAYMKDICPFLGIPKPERALLHKRFGFPDTGHEIEACHLLYQLPEREFHYIATVVLRKRANHLPIQAMPDVKTFVQTKSWWDTVDELTKVVGALVMQHQTLIPELDDWVRDQDFWVNRAAILHQLNFGEKTNVDRLFRLSLVQAKNPEFFIRKAIGWALRDYAWTDPEAIRTFVLEHRSEFSPLTIREALKNLHPPIFTSYV